MVLAPGPGESIPLWVILLGFAAFGTILLVLSVLMWWRRGGAWKKRSLVLAGVVVLLWGGYRVESEPRWHVNGLSNDSVALFDDTSEVRKFPLNTLVDCPNPTEQITRFRARLVEGHADPGQDQLPDAMFATMELAATRLEDAGWEVGRFQIRGGVSAEPDELSALGLNARRADDFRTLSMETSTLGSVWSRVFASECMAEENLFRLTGTSEVEEFGPER